MPWLVAFLALPHCDLSVVSVEEVRPSLKDNNRNLSLLIAAMTKVEKAWGLQTKSL